MRINDYTAVNNIYATKKLSFKSNSRKYLQWNEDKMYCISKMFRNDLDWNALSNFLLKNFKDKDNVKTVMFAASDGSEAYSLIISLLEHSSHQNKTAQKFFPIMAYDIDNEIVKAARSGYINTTRSDRIDLQIRCDDYSNYLTETDKELLIENDPTSILKTDYVKTMKAKRILTDNVLFNQADMFAKIKELDDNSNTVLMCRNVLGYFENDKIEEFVKLASQKLKSGSVFVIGNHDFVLFNIDDCLKKYGFEKVMNNVYKKA